MLNKNDLYVASLISTKSVIPAKAGIQKSTGFRVKPGMTNSTGLMLSCVTFNIQPLTIQLFNKKIGGGK